MKSSIQKISQSQIELTCEIPFDEFEKFIQKAIIDLGKDLTVAGFRKGNAPKEVIEKEVGQEKILLAAADHAIQDSYFKARQENNLEVISSPQVEILKLAKDNPFEFKAKVYVLPKFELPNYEQILSKIEQKKVEVTKEEIEKVKQEKVKWEKERLRQEILKKIAKEVKVEIPLVLIEQEQKRMLENLKNSVLQSLQTSFDDYLKKIGKTEKEISDSFFQESQEKIKISLVLRELGLKNNISVSDHEVEQEIKKSPFADLAKQPIDPEQVKSYTREALINEKTFQLLEGFLKK
ncbi:MAG: trigger factor [Patescibacteria group bacterium]|nr:hypothetical protein [Patescibacteria group bacterium]MBU1877222.1 hypothetical protein [Patescibacteria group bacterium]